MARAAKKNRAILVRPTHTNSLSEYWPSDSRTLADLQWAFVLWGKDGRSVFMAGHTHTPNFEDDDILFSAKQENTRAWLVWAALNAGNDEDLFEICVFEDVNSLRNT